MKLVKILALVALCATPAVAADKNKASAIALPWDQRSLDPGYKVHNFDAGVHAGYTWNEEYDTGIWGAHLGYMMRPNALLALGLEVDASRPFEDDLWLMSLRAKAGVFVTPQSLVYGTIGAAWTSETWDTGWVAGLGMENYLSPNVAVKLEYLHYEFESFGDSQLDVVRTGISLKF